MWNLWYNKFWPSAGRESKSTWKATHSEGYTCITKYHEYNVYEALFEHILIVHQEINRYICRDVGDISITVHFCFAMAFSHRSRTAPAIDDKQNVFHNFWASNRACVLHTIAWYLWDKMVIFGNHVFRIRYLYLAMFSMHMSLYTSDVLGCLCNCCSVFAMNPDI